MKIKEIPQSSLKGLKTYSLKDRKSKVSLKDFKFTKRGHVSISPSVDMSLRVTPEQAKEIKIGDRVVIKAEMNCVPKITLLPCQYKLFCPQSYGAPFGELHYTTYSCTINSKTYKPG